MIRVVVTQLILFALPFIGFFVYRVATHGWTGAAVADMRRPLFVLVILGGLFVIAGFAYFAFVREDHQGEYVPAHTIDGRFVPGRFEPR
ncbi:DUF6111 family protein [Acuticoccus sp.]|uniref:DUF6111 family protein n=1 Tax=Acuticoccus sp. TaxID=1904378 RepID=UPI003B52EBF5